jgi:hypothetical protein
MQRSFGRLAAQFFGGGPVGRAQAHAIAPASAANEPAPAAREGWLPASSHELLGEQRLQDVLVIGFCAAFSLIGWLMIVQGAEQIRLTRSVAQWPTADGIVEAAEVYEVDGSQGARWRPHVTYSYAVGGRLVMATRLSLGKAPLETKLADAERYVGQYPPGSHVTVFFNPRELTESVVDVSTPRTAYVNLGFGALLALVGPALLVLLGFWPRTRMANAAPAAKPD